MRIEFVVMQDKHNCGKNRHKLSICFSSVRYYSTVEDRYDVALLKLDWQSVFIYHNIRLKISAIMADDSFFDNRSRILIVLSESTKYHGLMFLRK